MSRTIADIPANRHYSPVEAAFAVAQYLPLDPKAFLCLAGLAGLRIEQCGDGYATFYQSGEVRADPDVTELLEIWLGLTPGGKQAVAELLRHHRAGEQP